MSIKFNITACFLAVIFCVLRLEAGYSDELYDDIMAQKKNINFEEYAPFSSELFSMPRGAKIINKIRISYIDENGLIMEKIVDINKSIELGDDFLFERKTRAKTAQIDDVSVSFNKNLNKISNNITKTPAPVIEIPSKTLKIDENLSIHFWQNSVKIVTNCDLNDSKISGKKITLIFNYDTNATLKKNELNLDKFRSIWARKIRDKFELSIETNDENFILNKENNGYKIDTNSTNAK